eukprot:PhM_4_TR3090/c4_g1_i6/m.106847
MCVFLDYMYKKGGPLMAARSALFATLGRRLLDDLKKKPTYSSVYNGSAAVTEAEEGIHMRTAEAQQEACVNLLQHQRLRHLQWLLQHQRLPHLQWLAQHHR